MSEEVKGHAKVCFSDNNVGCSVGGSYCWENRQSSESLFLQTEGRE